MKKPIFKDSLIGRLGRNEVTFESFLTDPEVFMSIKRNNKIVTTFALDYVDKLLDYAVFGDTSSNSHDISNKAMKIITANNSKLVYAISEGTKIASLARKILNGFEECIENNNSNVEKNANWSCIIGKFSAILETCFIKYPGNLSNFRFLLNFLQFCDNTMLSSFFELVVTSKKEEVKSYLRFIKIQNKLIDIITNWHNDNDNTISTEGILSIYNILVKYVTNMANDGCLSPSIVQFALEFLPTNDRNILAKQWKLANESIDTTNANDFATLYPNALMAIKGNIDLNNESNSERVVSYFSPSFHLFYKYQENALEFLSSLFSCYPSFVSEIDGKLLIQTLAEVYEEFSFSSFALSAVCTLMLILIEMSDIQEIVIDVFIPVIVEKMKEVIDGKDYLGTNYNDDDSDNNKSELSNNENTNSAGSSDENEYDSIINNGDDKNSININDDNTDVDESIGVKNEDKKISMSVNQRAFTLEFVKQVMEMCMSNDELKDQLGEQKDFLEVCVPRILKASSFLTNDYGGMCMIPSIVRLNNIDPLKSINLNVL